MAGTTNYVSTITNEPKSIMEGNNMAGTVKNVATININSNKVSELTPEMEEMLKNMTIREQMWKVSPEINSLAFRNFLNSHRKDLKWLTPIAAFAIAVYLVKTGKIDLKKLEKMVDEKLGIKLDAAGIKRFGANVAIASTVFAGTKIVGNLVTKKDASTKDAKKDFSLKDLSFAKINDMINEAKGLSAWKPKAEELLPISLSIIALFIISKPVTEVKALTWLKEQFFSIFGGVAYTISETIDNGILMLASKLNLDISEDEDFQKIKKFAALAVISLILLLTYGKSVAKKGLNKKALTGFWNQLMAGMKLIAPTVFATIVAVAVEKNILEKEDLPDDIYAEYFESTDESEDVDEENGNTSSDTEEPVIAGSVNVFENEEL